jgi:hypothetical protein
VFLVDGEEYTHGNPNGNGKRKAKKPTLHILNNNWYGFLFYVYLLSSFFKNIYILTNI